MKPLVLLIFHHTDETQSLKQASVDYSIEDCEEREITFYSINAVSIYTENGIDYGMIHSNGDQFVCTKNYKEVNNLINQNL
jgi:hypothetical protein